MNAADLVNVRARRGNKCPKCGNNKLYVLESRPASETKSSSGLRRRKKCSICDWRSTTYEIDAARFRALIEIEKEMATLISAIQPLMSKVVVGQSAQSRCHDCFFNQDNRCSHGIPEYQEEDSYDCYYFKANDKGEGG